MKKILKILGIVFLVLLIGAVVAFFVFNEKEPVGTSGADADAMAQKMVDAVNGDAWESTKWVSWSFLDMHHYVWNKERDLVRVAWDNYEVLLDTKTQEGAATEAGLQITGDQKEDLLSNAWNFFCNDSYWLNPVVKAFDPGVERSVVNLEDGSQGLKVKFTSGGTTPGDAYVWMLDEKGMPQHWKMWVNIIPLGGIGNSWEGWKELPGGAKISTTHKVMGRSVQMIDHIKAGNSFSDIGLTENPFSAL